MGSWENIKSKKSDESSKVFGMIEEVYSRTWLLGKRGRFRECKEDGSRVWEKTKYRSKKTGKLNMAEERDFRRGELLEKYIAKILYR